MNIEVSVCQRWVGGVSLCRSTHRGVNMKVLQKIVGIALSLSCILFLTGSGQPADTETRFPPELVSMLEEAFAESGWRGVQKLLSTGGSMSETDGVQPGSGENQSGINGIPPGSGENQSGIGGVQPDIKEEGVYDPGRFAYYFFDADGDGYPELGILEQYPDGHSAFLYLFRYDPDRAEYSLWNTLYPPYDLLLGTGKVLEYDGYHMKMDYGYYQLDAEGRVEYKAYLYYLPIRLFEQLCLVMLPVYTDPDLNENVNRRMEQCGICARGSGEWYFRVTEEQFEELEEIFWEAMESAEEKRMEVLYTYEELFGK